MTPTTSISARGTNVKARFPCPPRVTADYCPPIGKRVIIECTSSGPYTITGKAGISTNKPLVIPFFQKYLGGTYTCVSTNVCGRGMSSISILFRGNLVITFKTLSYANLCRQTTFYYRMGNHSME